jgi:pimeloyl-ACP methyl ester carboxylesterase
MFMKKEDELGRVEPIIGRYMYLTVQNIEYRVYYEENGQGIPMICQHAGGGDGMQWHDMLNDPVITSRYRVIAADLPYHGRSLPPESVEWWKQEYKLTKSFFMDFQVELSHALGLERPVFIGNAIAGFLALDLALEYPDKFRAVIASGAALRAGKVTLQTFYHPKVSNDYRRANAMYFCGPASPEKVRRMVTWCDSQSPPVTRGDLYFYFMEHDLTGKTDKIDTSRCAVYLLTGEYNPTSSVEDTKMLADQIRGARFTEMKGMSHGGMAENPPLFKQYLKPILEEIARM